MCSSCEKSEHGKLKPAGDHPARSLEEGYMKKHVIRTLLAGTTAGAALMLAAAAALAATLTVTVTRANPDGAMSASSGRVTFRDTRNGDTVLCTSSTVSGTTKNQTTSGASPVKIGTAKSTFRACTGAGDFTYTITMSGALAMTQATSGGVTAGGVTSVTWKLSGIACMVTATGSVPGTFTNPSGTKKPVLAFTPTAPNPDKLALKVASANCLGLFKAGDGIQFTASYTVTDPATLTVNAH
jgi:hypothetical protein